MASIAIIILFISGFGFQTDSLSFSDKQKELIQIKSEEKRSIQKTRLKNFGLAISGGLSAGEYHGAASGLELNPSKHWRAGLLFRPWKWLIVESGYSEINFWCSEGFCRNNEVLFTGTGLDAGLKLKGGGFWVGAGVLKHNLSIAWNESTEKENAIENSLGYNLKAGFYIPISRTFNLEFGLQYSAYDVKFPDDSIMNEVNYLTGELRLQVFIF